MEAFFTFLETHSTGVMLLILLLVTFVVIIRWLFQIFAIGKYSNRKVDREQDTSITYIITRSLVNIVDDFRHFLALLIVILFVILIIASMWAGRGDFDNVMEAMQLVIASLGGLLGSIIGYYYGESAARSKDKTGVTTDAGEITNEGGEIIEPEVEEVIEEIIAPDVEETE
jgi:membrane protein DedA with SNARE-associated domain